MIFYFSGTGNSKWIAEEMGNKLNEEVVNVIDVPKDKRYVFKKDEKVGVVFPVYAWNAPEVVLDFIERVEAKGSYVFAVATCGGEAGYTMEKISKILPLNSGYSVKMPNNYIVGSDVDSEERAIEKIKNAKLALEGICQDIENKYEGFKVNVGTRPFLKSKIISFMFNKFARSTKGFKVTETRCTTCGTCAKVCPTKTIKIEDKYPIWGKDCYQCLACINRCPEKAIEKGDETSKRGRYYFEKISGKLAAEPVNFSGKLIENIIINEEKGEGRLVLEGSQDQLVTAFNYLKGSTQFYLDSKELEAGQHLNISHKGIFTRSIPPQGIALEVRLMNGE